VEQGYITKMKRLWLRVKNLFSKKDRGNEGPHFVMYVKQLLEEKYGVMAVEQNGWQIITSLDWKAQQAAEKAVADVAPQNLKNYDAGNASLVSLDVNSGQILAMVGSKDYFDDSIDGQVNVALAPRQPGSSLKPLVYLEAFAKGYRPDTMMFDLVTNFGANGQPYIPHNYDSKEHGQYYAPGSSWIP